MYTIINKTKGTTYTCTGDWPSSTVNDMLANGDSIIVISTYSRTIKVPVYDIMSDTHQWNWEEFKYTPDMFK
jgi:hypothetical protein